MTFLTLWLLASIFARSLASKHRSVNLALETVLQFDKAEDVNVINKVQDFLSQIQVLLNKKRPVTDNDTRRIKRYQFTDFAEDLITTVKSFEDDDLMEVFRIVDKDFRTRKVDKDLIDRNARRFISRKLTEIRNQPALDIRSSLDTILRELRAGDTKKNSYILDFVNTLYKHNSERKLSKLIKRLNLFRKSARKPKVVLKNIIEKVVNDVIYEHYNNLQGNERRYIKKIVKSYLIGEITTTKEPKIKHVKVTEENISTEEKSVESTATEQFMASELTPETFKDVSKKTTKKLFTHITLYPKTIKMKKILKFRTGLPTINIYTPTDKENTENTKNTKDSKETKEILQNNSVEINVNLMLKQSRDAEEHQDSQIVESSRVKSTPNKVSPRASKTKSRKNKKYRKSSKPTLSIETFGSLHQRKTPKQDNKKIQRLITYNDKTTLKEKYLKSSYVDSTIKETRPELHTDTDYRRVNKILNLNEIKITESNIKDITTQLFTKESIPPTVTTSKTTAVTTTKITKSDVLNEIYENVTEFKEVSKNIKLEKVTKNKEVSKDNFTQFENNAIKNINHTTEIEVSTIAFDVNNYVKNSEILNFNDDERRKQIEKQMKADLGSLLETTSTTATTEGFTDIFKELEDAFQI